MMPVRQKVLVLLGACNGADWIREQLESILGQRHVDVHVVVQDDASSDATVEAVGSIVSENSRVELRCSREPSGSASQNFFSLIRTCDASGYDFVALSDQDDIWGYDKLRRAVAALGQGKCVGYSSAVTAIWPGGKRAVLRQSVSVTESDYLFEGAGQGCTFVLTTGFYARLREFLRGNEGLTRLIHYHDWSIYALARSWGECWVFDQEPTMLYRQHGGNDTGARSSIRGIGMRIAKIRSGWYRSQLLRVAHICHVAAPGNEAVRYWRSLLTGGRSLAQRWRSARFCAKNGRRRRIDTVILVLSALAGWV